MINFKSCVQNSKTRKFPLTWILRDSRCVFSCQGGVYILCHLVAHAIIMHTSTVKMCDSRMFYIFSKWFQRCFVITESKNGENLMWFLKNAKDILNKLRYYRTHITWLLQIYINLKTYASFIQKSQYTIRHHNYPNISHN
jgi:hypothetical protein